MRSWLTYIEKSPALTRATPFIVFALLTMLQGQLGASSAYWLYAAKTGLGAALLWALRKGIQEMQWKFSVEGILAGVLVFALWVGLDDYYPKLSRAGSAWSPFAQFGESAALAWMFIIIRMGGTMLVVPPMEEVFYRSLLYRWIVRPDFASVSLGTFAWKPFVVTALLFGVAHYEWLAGVLCACAYQGLVCWKKRLGDAITAHAVTNGLLGLWVLWKGAWHFW